MRVGLHLLIESQIQSKYISLEDKSLIPIE